MQRWLLDLLVSGELLAFADFAEAAFSTLSGGRLGDGGHLAAWRSVRRFVFTELDALGLAATVRSSADVEPLARHRGHLAGVVRVHRHGHEDEPPPPRPVDDRESAHRGRMLTAHGLRPADGLELSLRGLLGQQAPYERPSWLDHARGWVDRWGEFVLSAEPYDHVREIESAERIVHDVEALPLLVEAHPGVWNDHTVLLLIRADPEADPLPAVHDPMADRARLCTEYVELQRRCLVAESAADARLNAELPPPSDLRGLVSYGLAGRLTWATRRLALHERAGHIAPGKLEELVCAMVAHLQAGCPAFAVPPSAANVLGEARERAYFEAMGAAHAEVRAVLGRDWLDRVEAVLKRPDFASDHLRAMRVWLVGVLAEEANGE